MRRRRTGSPATGYIIGNFERAWLGIPPTERETFIRFGEFHQMLDDKIVKAYVILDLIEVMQQAGCDPLPPSRGISGFVPPPRAADGILFAEQASAESQKTFQIAYDMLFQGMNSFDQERKESMGFPRFWHDNMHWFRPRRHRYHARPERIRGSSSVALAARLS